MSVTIGEYLFLVLVWLFAAQLIALALILLMQLLMPKAVLNQYFTPPYFKEAECLFFTGFPFAYIRTVMFMTVLAFPKRGTKRKLTEAYKLVPKWYRKASAIIIISTVSLFILTLALLFGLYFYSKCLSSWCS